MHLLLNYDAKIRLFFRLTLNFRELSQKNLKKHEKSLGNPYGSPKYSKINSFCLGVNNLLQLL